MENEQPNAPEKGGSNSGPNTCGVCGCPWYGMCMQNGRCPWWGKGRWTNRDWRKGGGCHGGGIWFVGWLFTIGFLKLAFWKGVLAVVVWPYYLGSFFAR